MNSKIVFKWIIEICDFIIWILKKKILRIGITLKVVIIINTLNLF
jgi:hypothetical protein